MPKRDIVDPAQERKPGAIQSPKIPLNRYKGTVEHEAKSEVSCFHAIEIFPGTRLATLAGGRRRLRVNSRHHQGLRPEHVAPGLRISATAPDGVVEGVEGTGKSFLVGIQFHPERPGEVPELIGIFQLLVASAAGAKAAGRHSASD